MSSARRGVGLVSRDAMKDDHVSKVDSPRSRLDRMHELMAGHVEHGGVPGLVTLVSRRGEVARRRGRHDGRGRRGRAGAARHHLPHRVDDEARHRRRGDDPGRGVPAPARRAGRLAGCPSSPIARCCDALDSPLDDTVPATRPITVRDVLTFRMGLGMLMVAPGTYPVQREFAALELGDGPPVPQNRRHRTSGCAGSARCRSCTNRASSGPTTSAPTCWVCSSRAPRTSRFAEFLRERIFEPLAMRDTAFSVPPEKIDRFVDQLRDRPRRRADWWSSTKRPAASGARSPRSRRVAAGWCRPPTTSSPSAR